MIPRSSTHVVRNCSAYLVPDTIITAATATVTGIPTHFERFIIQASSDPINGAAKTIPKATCFDSDVPSPILICCNGPITDMPSSTTEIGQRRG